MTENDTIATKYTGMAKYLVINMQLDMYSTNLCV